MFVESPLSGIFDKEEEEDKEGDVDVDVDVDRVDDVVLLLFELEFGMTIVIPISLLSLLRSDWEKVEFLSAVKLLLVTLTPAFTEFSEKPKD